MQHLTRLLTSCVLCCLLHVSPTIAETYNGRPISIEVQDADLHHFFRIISEVSGLNVVVDQDVQGKVTMRLRNVPWDQVLAIVLRQHGLYQVTEGKVMMIVPVQKVPALYGRSRKVRY